MLGPIRNAPDGSHAVSLRLAPEGLGTVDAVVTVNAGRIVVELKADTPEARQALTQALPQLRQEMGSTGQQATVFLSDPGSQGRSFAQPQNGASTDPWSSDDGDYGVAPDPAVQTLSRTSSSTVDLRL